MCVVWCVYYIKCLQAIWLLSISFGETPQLWCNVWCNTKVRLECGGEKKNLSLVILFLGMFVMSWSKHLLPPRPQLLTMSHTIGRNSGFGFTIEEKVDVKKKYESPVMLLHYTLYFKLRFHLDPSLSTHGAYFEFAEAMQQSQNSRDWLKFILYAGIILVLPKK